MSTYVLIHGAWHGAWCWERVSPHLTAAGHRVIAPDLAGLDGISSRVPGDVSLQDHVDGVVAMLEEHDLRDVVLVGHSYAGLIVRQVADRVPDRVARLILLDAWSAPDGKSIADVAPGWFVDGLRRDAGSD